MIAGNTDVKSGISRFDISFFVILFTLVILIIAGFIIK